MHRLAHISTRQAVAASVLVASGIFILDLSLPLGVAAGVPYVALVLMSLYSPWRHYTFILAMVGTFLTILGYFFSPPAGIPWMVLTNRLLAVCLIWLTALFCRQRRQTEMLLQEAHDELEQRVEERTIKMQVEIAERKQAEEALAYRLRVEELEGEISSSFVSAESTGIDEAVTSAIEEVARFADASRSSLYLLSDDLERVTNTHEWCANPEDSQIALLQDIPFSTFGWHRDELHQHKTISISRFEDYPPTAKGEREWMEEHGFRSLLFVPLLKQGKLCGALGIYGEIGDEITWPSEFLHMLRTTGDLILNILERRRAEEALRESEVRYRTVYNNTPVMLHSIDRDGRLISVSDYWLSALGYTRDEVIGRKSTEFLAEESRERAEEALPEYFRTGVCRDIPFQFTRKNGETVDVLLSAIAERDGNGSIERFLAVVTDITERKRAEQALLQSSRLIALGEMAAGIAHELNQPLTVISTLAEGVQIRLEESIEMTRERLLEWSDKMMEGVERMSRIIDHLRVFSRDHSEEPKEQVALNDVVQGTLTMTQTQLKSHGIELALELAEGLPMVLGDRYRLEQMLINLLHNARDAVEKRRKQMSSLEDRHWGMRLAISTFQAGEQVVLEVEDNGVGMDEETRHKVLEPFFTTKEPGEGTGLGLSISHAIVKDHNSEIECESEEGEGTVFRVRFPISRESPS